MYTIKGFTTKKDVLKQLNDASVKFRLPFKAEAELKSEFNPLEKIETESFDKSVQTVTKIVAIKDPIIKKI